MKVLKFGGTSVGSATGLLQAKKVIESCIDDVIVVVSALGGITDQLLSTAREAASGNPEYELQMQAISSRHYQQVEDTVLPEMKDNVRTRISELLGELSNIFKGVFLINTFSFFQIKFVDITFPNSGLTAQ